MPGIEIRRLRRGAELEGKIKNAAEGNLQILFSRPLLYLVILTFVIFTEAAYCLQ